MAVLHTAQQECRNRDLLVTHSDILVAVVAGHHRPQADCAAGELIYKWSTERINVVIRHYDRVGIYSYTREEGMRYGGNGHCLENKNQAKRKQKEKEKKVRKEQRT